MHLYVNKHGYVCTYVCMYVVPLLLQNLPYVCTHIYMARYLGIYVETMHLCYPRVYHDKRDIN